MILKPKRKYLGRFHRRLGSDEGLHLWASAAAVHQNTVGEVPSLLLSFSSCYPQNGMIRLNTYRSKVLSPAWFISL